MARTLREGWDEVEAKAGHGGARPADFAHKSQFKLGDVSATSRTSEAGICARDLLNIGNVAHFRPPNLLCGNDLRSENRVWGSGGRGFESRRPDCV